MLQSFSILYDLLMYVLYNIVQANSVCKHNTPQITHLL